MKQNIEKGLLLRDELKKKRDRKGSQARQIFRYFDVDGNGEVSVDEFINAVRRMGISKSDEEVVQLHKDLDKDNSGAISYQEFINLIEVSCVRNSFFIVVFYATYYVLLLLFDVYIY